MTLASLLPQYTAIRNRTLELVKPLLGEDCCVQSMSETSPVKWHLGHVAWFFEMFVLQHYEKPFKPFHGTFSTMFSSYNASGQPHPDPKRGLFTRPSLLVTGDYCRNIDERMGRLLRESAEDEMLRMLVVLGLHHEQQHQELILSDIKHLFSQSPLNPCYKSPQVQQSASHSTAPPPLEWHHFDGGLVEIGYQGEGFSYDNESPRHKQYLQPYQLGSRLITNGEYLHFTNGEYLHFMETGGYDNPAVWLVEGWDWMKANEHSHPLYWRRNDNGWTEFTLSGPIPLDPGLPAIHISLYEADAFARWCDARLPTEAEWENAASRQSIDGCFADNNRLAQLYGDAWEWTQSSYSPYPSYNPAKANANEPMSCIWNEAVGEYNSRSMVNQYVLRGGSCATPKERIRASFRNFFPASTCYQFSGIRLARDVK